MNSKKISRSTCLYLSNLLAVQAKIDKRKLLELYELNYGFLCKVAKNYSGANKYFEDYLQLGYLALTEAVENYPGMETGYDFLSYYRTCLHSHFFRFNCVMQQCVKLPKNQFTGKRDFFSYVNMADYEDDYYSNDDIEGFCETKELQRLIKTVLKETLDETNLYILIEVVCEGRSMASLGREFGLTRDSIRKRLLRTYAKLRENDTLQKIAQDYLIL